jgi:hypothetical protein
MGFNMRMKYIELPPGVKIEQNEEKKHFFLYQGTCYFLDAIIDATKNNIFNDDLTNLHLSVSLAIPKENKLYAEYLPNNDMPSKWCIVVNGEIKSRQNDQFNSTVSWIKTDRYAVLSEERKQEVTEARQEQKRDRYDKGPKSV